MFSLCADRTGFPPRLTWGAAAGPAISVPTAVGGDESAGGAQGMVCDIHVLQVNLVHLILGTNDGNVTKIEQTD